MSTCMKVFCDCKVLNKLYPTHPIVSVIYIRFIFVLSVKKMNHQLDVFSKYKKNNSNDATRIKKSII